jgi:hypothetical protein
MAASVTAESQGTGDGTPHPRPLPHKGGGENDDAEGGFGARPGQALTPRPPLPMLGEGENDDGTDLPATRLREGCEPVRGETPRLFAEARLR